MTNVVLSEMLDLNSASRVCCEWVCGDERCVGGSIWCWTAVRLGGTEEAERADTETEGDETTDAGWGTTPRDYISTTAAAAVWDNK